MYSRHREALKISRIAYWIYKIGVIGENSEITLTKINTNTEIAKKVVQLLEKHNLIYLENNKIKLTPKGQKLYTQLKQILKTTPQQQKPLTKPTTQELPDFLRDNPWIIVLSQRK